jgi:hypothetical protein
MHTILGAASASAPTIRGPAFGSGGGAWRLHVPRLAGPVTRSAATVAVLESLHEVDATLLDIDPVSPHHGEVD